MITRPKTHVPGSGVEQVRVFFEDGHVHMALIVAPDGRLVTTIERADLAAATSSSAPVVKLGTLTGRTARPADPLGAATAALLREGRRRLAVVDDSGRLLGLLCLKKDRTGYCFDEGIRERAQRAAQPVTRLLRAGCPSPAGSGGVAVGGIGGLTRLSRVSA
jgi:CBS-domain-containing membrane protein